MTDGQPPGFEYEGKRIFFIDARGEDNMSSRMPLYDGVPRYRADLYYQPGFAKTAFFYSELAYEVFLAASQPKCYPTYAELCEAVRQRTQA